MDTLVCILIAIFSFIIGLLVMLYRCGSYIDENTKKVKKYFAYYELLNKWITLKDEKKKISQYLNDYGFNTVAIYGVGKMGVNLKNEFIAEGIDVLYLIDEGDQAFYQNERIYTTRDILPMVDAIVVTPINEFEMIKKNINERNEIKVISIREIVEYSMKINI